MEPGQRTVEFHGEARPIVLHELELGFQGAAPPVGLQAT